MGSRNEKVGRSQGGRNLFSSSIRAISCVASSLRSAGTSIASSISATENDRRREQVQWVAFDKLDIATSITHHVLLLAYRTGFQVWDVEDADNVCEVVSKREGPVAFLQMQPQPITMNVEEIVFKAASPLLIVVTGDVAGNEGIPGAPGCGYGNSTSVSSQSESSNFTPTTVCFYSMKTHAYVHKQRFREAIYGVRCSPRVVAVALRKYIYCYNAATLQLMFNVSTFPIPQGVQGPGSINIGYGPMDVGLRWLAYVATEAFVSNTGRISPQNIIMPRLSLNGSTMAHYAKESSKQIAAGIVTLGDIGYKTLTKYCYELLPDSFSPPGSGSINWKSNLDASGGHSRDIENVGTVIVKDFISNVVVAQLRPHTSPISALCFDPSGTLLVTASIYGCNIHVFRIMPSASRSDPSTCGSNVIHLYKLVRGVTNAVIQDISFSDDSHSIAISSSRGTTHLFAISPFSGVVGLHNRGGNLVDGITRSPFAQSFSAMCPCSSSGLLKGDKQLLAAQPVTLSAVCKIRNGCEGWCHTISGAAAAARGKMNVLSAPVAAIFHNGGNHCMGSMLGTSDIKNQLWVFSPSGYVVQYALYPCLAQNIELCGNTFEIALGSNGLKQTEDLRVIAEPLQKWDVGRKSNCKERESDRYKLRGTEDNKEGRAILEGCRNVGIHPQSDTNEKSGKEETIFDEKHCWFLSNVEVHTHPERLLVWAKPQIHFHMINVEVGSWTYGEIEIERLLTHAVEIKSKELMPVFEHGHVARMNVSGSVPDDSAFVVNMHSSWGTSPNGIGRAEIQHSNSIHSSHSSMSDLSVQTMSRTQAAPAHLWGPCQLDKETLGSPITSKFSIQPSNFEMVGIDVPTWRQNDISQIQASENCAAVDMNSNIIPIHGYFGKDDLTMGTGHLEVTNEKDVNGMLVHEGTLANRTLSPDDNSESFDSNRWDLGADGETISPSSVLQTANISNQCLQKLQGNAKLQEDFRTAEDTKSVDSNSKEDMSEGEENEEDVFGGGLMFGEEE